MNFIWALTVVASLITFFICGDVSKVSTVMSDSASGAIELVLSLAGIMALWGGFMEIAEQSGVTNVFAKVLSPLVKRLFKGAKNNKEVMSAISMNITANIFGLGNAATPLGVEAMRRMKAISNQGNTATDEMVTFVIINTASVQIIPTTVAMLRAKFGSTQPMVILPAVLLASVCSLIVGIAADYILRRYKNA